MLKDLWIFTKWILITAGTLFLLFVALGLSGVLTNDKPDQSSALPPASQAPAPPPVVPAPTPQTAQVAGPKLPADEQLLIDIVNRFALAYDKAPNDMAQGATRPDRAAAICAALKTQPTNWIGTVETLSSNADGNGILGARIARNVVLATTNNSLTDIYDHTLLPHGSAVFNQAVQLKTGQAIVFSGNFLRSPIDCLQEQSLMVRSAMDNPEFSFRFSSIKQAP